MKHPISGIVFCLVGCVASATYVPDHNVEDFKARGVPPKPIRREAPSYPYEMKRGGLSGDVMVEFIIDKEGNVKNPYIVGSNNPWFERPALDSIIKWKFTPGQLDGRLVEVLANQHFDFSMNSGPRGLWMVPPLKNKDKIPLEIRWDIAPVAIKTAFPVYPLSALRAKIAGWTKVGFIIGPDGKISAAKLVEATTPEMGLAALATIDAWQFTPPTRKDGAPCSAATSIDHEFKPAGEGDVPITKATREILRLLEKSPEKIITATELDQSPQAISRRPPVYPTTLRKAGLTGEALIEFYIDEKGDVQLPAIINSSAPEFGYAAVQAMATWRYEVPRKNGKPVVARVQIPIQFALPTGNR